MFGVALALGLLGATRARADEHLLSGPHPMLKENSASVSLLIGNGLGDTFSGRGVGLGYGYMLQGPLWLDLQANLRTSACNFFNGRCGTYAGNDVELLAGASWHFRTDVPAVPYVRGTAGLVYLYPQGAISALGLAVRGAVGVRYYFFDWFGFGIEAALSAGHAYFGSDYGGSHTYAVGDMVLGAEVQF